MYGWAGSILDIDLSTREVRKKPLELEFVQKWLGGEGFGARLLWENLGPGITDGLDQRNILVYATGLCTATMAPASGRLEVIVQSPLTGIFGDSNTGGHFGPELKLAGYDLLLLRGRAEVPVYVWIDNDQVEIREARHLWGRTVSETDAALKEELGDPNIQVSCIGPAGEHLVRFACLVNNLVRTPAWTGSGAVAGSKNLKAVAVRGSKAVKIARPAEFSRACWEAREKVKRMASYPVRSYMGTAYLYRAIWMGGGGSLRNYTIGQAPKAFFDQICGERWAEDYFERRTSCQGCVVQCGHYAVVKKGPYKGLATSGLEYAACSPYLYWYGSSRIAFAIAAVKYCNEIGMDATEPGILLGWATDCFKRGIVTERDTDGLVLDWGKEKIALELLRRMAYREGFGDLLAEGLARAAKKLGRGSEYYAHTIKGRPCKEESARTGFGSALASVTSTRGADHLKGWPYFELATLPPEVSLQRWGSRTAGDCRSAEGKAGMTIYDQAMSVIIDSLGGCKFHSRAGTDGLTEDDYARLYSAATGVETSGADLLHAADRIYTQEQAFNVRLGMRRQHDTLPQRYLEEPIPGDGQYGGKRVITREKLDKMLDDYYLARGWDVATGVPTRETLEALGLKDVADEMERLGCAAGVPS